MNELSLFLEQNNDRTIVFFGASDVALQTARKFGPPDFCVDNSSALWGSTYGVLNDIRRPSDLASEKNYAVVICSVAEDEIREQLGNLGLTDQSLIALSPYANSMAPTIKLREKRGKLLVASAGPPLPDTDEGAGLYFVEYGQAGISHHQIVSGACHSIAQFEDGTFLVASDLGILHVDVDSGRWSEFAPLPKGVRPHGLAWDSSRELALVVANSSDSVLSINRAGEIVGERKILRGGPGGVALHHINDIAVTNDILILSMFSFTGSWKSGVYDGGLYAFEPETMKSLGPLVSGLKMPHSPVFWNSDLWVCNSLPGKLLNTSSGFEATLPTFCRGLDFQSDFVFVGASRNRNAVDASFSSGSQVRDIQSGFHIVDLATGLSRSFSFTANIPEIHALKVLE